MTHYLQSTVLELSPGSNIQVCYLVYFHPDSSITEAQVLEELIADVTEDGEITDSSIYVLPSSLAQTQGIVREHILCSVI